MLEAEAVSDRVMMVMMDWLDFTVRRIGRSFRAV
jgi:hypothetical protein